MKTLHREELKQINFLDDRFYTMDEKNYYPSVTSILDVYPKGFGFIQWLKDLGASAEDVLRRAGDQGSKIHSAIDNAVTGLEVCWADGNGIANYTEEEWKMIMRFKEFWDKYKPEVIINEVSMVSENLGYGGTVDLVCKIDGKVWLIDYKSSNAIYTSHELQIAAYAEMWNEKNPHMQIEHTGILHLKALTRGEDKKGDKMQGAGWQMKDETAFGRKYTEAFKLFQHVQAIWKEENPNPKPKNVIYPDRIKL